MAFLLGVLLTISVKADIVVDYEFQKAEFYNSDFPIYDQNFNVVNQTRYNGEYPANQSFTDDIVGEHPQGWEISDERGGSINVIAESNGHKKVLELDDIGIDALGIRYTIDGVQTSGIYEYWFKGNDTTDTFYMLLYGTDSTCIYIIIASDKIQYRYLGSFYDANNGGVSDDLWYHVKIVFDCIVDTYDFYLNNNLLNTNVPFHTTGNNINNIRFFTHDTTKNYKYQIDALDINYTKGYIEGCSRFSLVDIDSSIQEVNRYEWALTAPNTLVVAGTSNVNGWFDYEVGENGGSAYVSYENFNENALDREYYINSVSTDDMGIYKDYNLDSITKRLNVTARINFTIWTCPSGKVNFTIYSSDSSIIADLSFVMSGDFIDMFMLSGGEYTKFGSSFIYVKSIEFNLYIDYDLNLIIFRYLFSDIGILHIEEFLCESDKNGLSEIRCINYGESGGNVITRVDYIGIYADYIPISGGAYGFMEIIISEEVWDFRKNNLVILDSVGISKMYRFSDNGSRDAYFPNDYNIVEISLFTNHSGFEIYNMYADFNSSYLENPSIIIYLNLWFDLSSLTIEGVKMVEGNNTYYPQLFSGGVDNSESYFRVDSNNRLQFKVYFDDNYPEYISANFDVENFACQDKSIKFKSNMISGGFGDIQIGYSDMTSNYVPFPYYTDTITLVLPQTQWINKFMIFAYDDDKFNSSSCEGYITDLQTIDYTDIDISIITIGLLNVIVPLLMMIVVPFASASRYGNKVVLPLFGIMATLCFAVQLLEVWVYFIIVFGLIVFIFTKRKVRGEA